MGGYMKYFLSAHEGFLYIYIVLFFDKKKYLITELLAQILVWNQTQRIEFLVNDF